MKGTKKREEVSGRRSARIVLRIPLFINATDSSSGTEWEQVETLVVSKHGAMVRTHQNFAVGTTLEIRMCNKDRTARARVAWKSAQLTPQGIELGFEILDSPGFWEISFPIDGWSEKTQSQKGRR